MQARAAGMLLAADRRTVRLDEEVIDGTISLTVSNGKFSAMSVSCTGTMKVVLVETPVSVSADISIQDSTAPQFPAKAVTALTQTNG